MKAAKNLALTNLYLLLLLMPFGDVKLVRNLSVVNILSILFVFSVFVYFLTRVFERRPLVLRISPLTLGLLMLFMMSLAFSSFLINGNDLVMRNFLQFFIPFTIQVLVFIGVVFLVESKTEVFQALKWSLFGGLAAALVGFAQLYFSSLFLHSFIPKAHKVVGSLRLQGLFFDPNICAVYLLGIFYLLLAVNASGRTIFRTRPMLWAVRGTIVLVLAAIILTYSRGGWITLAISWFIYIFMRMRKTALNLAQIKMMAVALFIGAISVAEYLFNLNIRSSLQRASLFDIALSIFASAPVFGIGLGNFYDHIMNYTHLAAHNSYLQILAEGGVISLVLYVFFFIFQMVYFFNIIVDRSYSRNDRLIMLGFFMGITCFLLGSIFLTVWTGVKYVWIYLALMQVMALNVIRDRRAASEQA